MRASLSIWGRRREALVEDDASIRRHRFVDSNVRLPGDGEDDPAAPRSLKGVSVCMLVFNNLDRDPRVWKEASSLAGAGAQVEILMLRGEGQDAESVLREGVTVRRITKHSPAIRRPRALVGAWQFLRRMHRGRYDVVHCHDGATLPWALWAGRSSRARVVYDAHEFFPGFIPDRLGPRWKARLAFRVSLDRLAEKALVRRADAVITVNDSIAALLTHTHRLRAVPTVLRNSVPFWEPTGDEAGALHDRLGLPSDTPVILFQGRVDPARGVDSCIRAMAQLERVHFATLGSIDDALRRLLSALAADLGVEHRVHFLDPVPYPELLQYAASADVGMYVPTATDVSPSYLFSLPNKLFELVMARTPSVMSAFPEIERLLRTYDCGVVVPSPSPRAIAEAVAQVLVRPRSEWRDSLDRAARELCWEQDERRLLELYERVTGVDRDRPGVR